jgi:hypothetical protein
MIQTFDQLYLEIAKQAKASGNMKLFKVCLQNKQRELKRTTVAVVQQRNKIHV